MIGVFCENFSEMVWSDNALTKSGIVSIQLEACSGPATRTIGNDIVAVDQRSAKAPLGTAIFGSDAPQALARAAINEGSHIQVIRGGERSEVMFK